MSGDDRPGAGGPQMHCHICSAELPQDATFCLQCGSRVRAVPTSPAATPATGSLPLVAPSVAAPRHATMLGVAPTAPAVAAAQLHATLLGSHPAGSAANVVPAPAELSIAPSLPVPTLPAAVANKQRTMIGVAREALAMPPVPKSERPPTSVPAPPVEPSVVPKSRTMMGVAPPAARSFAPPAPSSVALPPQEPTTPLMDPNARRRRESPPFVGEQRVGPGSPPATHFPSSRTEDELRLPKRTPLGLWIAGAVVGLALVGGAVMMGVHLFGASGPPPLQAEVRLADGTLRVHATLPGADARWRVRHHGAEFPVDASGAVEFPLSGLDPNAVGEIVLPIEVIDAARARTARALRIVIGYRVVADLDHLGDDPPRVHLRFRVPSGAKLSIAGQPIALSGQLGVAEIPAPAALAMESPTAVRSDRFPIEVRTASGVVIRGEYELRVPRLPLRVESPGPLSLINASMVTVEGSLPRAARVLVGTQLATLMGSHFRAEVPIAPGANMLTVQGFAPGGAPVTTTLMVYREVTPQDYLASGGGDRGLAPLVSPPASTVRLRVRGRVINSTQAVGEMPTFQLLVSDRTCPSLQCLAWVDLAPGSAVRINEIVEVVGETHGTRSYVNQTGQRRTDTVIRALFILRP